jgi:tRNA (cytidine/uridine-2'-O-)-methyltransferase
MLHVALLEPEIPPNTGNIARLCAATGAVLHLVGRLGFRIDDRSLRRAGLDYWHHVDIRRHDSYADFDRFWIDSARDAARIFAFSTRGTRNYTHVTYQDEDCLLLGGETRGLPGEVLERFGERVLTIPMPAGKVRSLNLATATGIVLYEALRQLHGW